nr:hypothetical protein [Tanacetum cinerariifolium]
MAKQVELNKTKNKCSKANNGDEKLNEDIGSKTNKEPVDQEDQAFLEELESLKQQAKEADDAAETLRKTFAQINTAGTTATTASPSRNVSVSGPSNPNLLTYVNQDDSQIPGLEDIYEVPNDEIFTSASYDAEGAVADFTNLESSMNIKPKKISQALKYEIRVDAMQEELLQFKTQHVWILVDLPFRKKVIGTKRVYKNKKDERGVVVRNKARLVAQGHRQEEGKDYENIFAPVARIKDIRIFLAFAFYIGFIVYQMDVKSAFLYGKINEEVYVSQPLGFIDPKFPKKVYKVVKALYGLHQAPRDWYDTLSTFFVKSRYRRGIIDKSMFIRKDQNDIMLTASTPIETKKPLVKDVEAVDVDLHLYRSMIGSLMYLIASRPDIMYAVCACSRFQVTLKTSHLQAVKRIFRYLKGKPKLGIWYPKESAFDLEAYSYSDYAGENLDRIQQEVVNFLVGDLLHGSAKSKQLWLHLLHMQSMLLLQTDVDKYYGFRIKC